MGLVAWCGLLLFQAAQLRQNPPLPRPAGEILGWETVLIPGETRLQWEGPYGRKATWEDAGGRFEVWRHPLWVGGYTRADAIFVVDHTIGWGEAMEGSLRRQPWLHGACFLMVLAGIAWSESVAQGLLLLLLLGGIKALSPAWILASDPLAYHQAARGLLQGELPAALWPPGWPALLAIFYAFAGEDPVVGRLLGVLLLGGGALLLGRGNGRAVLLGVLCMEWLAFAPSLYSEGLFITASLAFLLLPSPSFAAGAAAVAVLTRPQALLLVPFVVWFRWEGRERRPFLLYFLPPLLLWIGLRSAAEGRWIPVSESACMNLWIGHRPGADGDWHDPWPEPPKGFCRAAVESIKNDPTAFMKRFVGNVARLWGASRSDPTLASRPLPLPQLPWLGLLVLAAVGGWRSRRGELLLWLLATTLLLSLFFVPVRYRLGLLPALLVLAAAALRPAQTRT